MGTIPLSGDALEHNASSDPLPRTEVSSAMIAKVGAAARYRTSAAPIVAALPALGGSSPEPHVTVCVSLMFLSYRKARCATATRRGAARAALTARANRTAQG